ncbi:hypothetical protein LshimejAT787_1202670 [Lyophyllum shimeji]|uniref:Uncharacterized protein n=1 Tax=Lyophyllum shimeji TaxID=47721 RepID=A0A9P3URM9_LYOSH|nr:hypothetical protein LshimejAT787_1202670 [Lyophyllum shimeji]
MAPSGYVQVDPAKPPKTKGIRRQSALHLTLPLVERHSCAYDSCSSEENLLTIASSRYTISAAPKSSASASLYSQESYHLSPPVFSETHVNKRRFGLAVTPVEEGPWRRPEPLRSAQADVFVVDLKSAAADANPFLGSDEVEDVDETDGGGGVHRGNVEEKKVLKVYAPAETTLLPPIGKPMEVAPPRLVQEDKEYTNAKLKKSRMTSKMIGKMLSRLSVHQSQSNSASSSTLPAVPALPPQISIALPSPGLKFPNSPRATTPRTGTKDDLHAFVLDKQMHAAADKAGVASAVPGSNNRATLPSTWKPRRPPSPLPKALRRQGKQKHGASALAHPVVASPPPPLPSGACVVVESRKVGTGYASFSTPLGSAASLQGPSSRWDEVRTRLRARALKSEGYAVYDGGIISPIGSS